jgi:carbonic anhydrase
VEVIYRYDPHQPVTAAALPDADAALAALRAGNDRFAEFVARMQRRTLGQPAGEPMVVPVSPISLGLPIVHGTAPKQAPFAVVLGCSDARAPVETIFNQSSNDLFVVRVAGNVLGTEGLGSIDYAVRNLGGSLRLVIALGHTECGAVSAAVDTYLNPKTFADIACTHALRSLVDGILIAVRGAAQALERVGGAAVKRQSGYRDALVETAVYLNAAVTAFDVAREVGSLQVPRPRVVYGVYDLAGVRVRSTPGGDATFGDAPAHADEFAEIAIRLAEAVVAKRLRAKESETEPRRGSLAGIPSEAGSPRARKGRRSSRRRGAD